MELSCYHQLCYKSIISVKAHSISFKSSENWEHPWMDPEFPKVVGGGQWGSGQRAGEWSGGMSLTDMSPLSSPVGVSHQLGADAGGTCVLLLLPPAEPGALCSHCLQME